jgi:hypothetical protein
MGQYGRKKGNSPTQSLNGKGCEIDSSMCDFKKQYILVSYMPKKEKLCFTFQPCVTVIKYIQPLDTNT